jgi:outer membrane immunogenic protein
MNLTRPSLGVLALAALLGPAGAADLPPLAPTAPAVAPLPSWYGFFIGVQAGYGVGSDPVEFTTATGIYAGHLGTTIPLSLAGDPRGAVVGARWGTNWHTGSWVYGFLSDFSWSDIRNSETLVLTDPVFGTRTNFAEQHLQWFGTTRLRAGYLVTPNLLFYGSGGLASGTMEVSVANTAGGPCAVAGACPAGSDDTVRYGWSAGLGVEYQWGNWSLSVDYVHYDLGRFSFAYGDGVSSDALVASTRFSGDMVRGAINYRFDWTFLDLLTGRRPL